MRILFILSTFLIVNNLLIRVPIAFGEQKNTTAIVFELMKQRKWAECERLSSPNSALNKIVLSQKFLDSNYKATSFEQIVEFLRKNPKWPQTHVLKLRAESLINNNSDKKLIIQWFAKHSPITGNGYKYYALAAADIYNDAITLQSIIKNGWIFGNFSLPDQRDYYKRFRKYLSVEDNVKKIDNYLWQEQITAAKNSLYLVNDHYKKTFNAQIALIQKHKNALSLYRTIPKEYRTSGLVYEYLSLRKKELLASREIVTAIKSVKILEKYSQQFWKLQSYLAREFIEKKKYNDAYLVVSKHVALSPSDLSDAEFLSGWIALSFLKKTELATKHFQKFNHIVKTPISKSRGYYWLGRTYYAAGDKEKAKQLYSLAATKYPYTFYGQISAVELNHSKLYFPGNVQIEKYKNHECIRNNDIVKATILVSKYGLKSLAEVYIKSAIEHTTTTEQILALTACIASNKNTYYNACMSKYAMHKHVFIKNHAFPTPYEVKHLPTETSLTYSIIRQESVFDQYAVSSADARGLMQLIKTTACNTAKGIGDSCRITHLTKDYKYNLKLGTNYLNNVIKDFNGSYILAIASYNGGPHNVKKWIELHGDPRYIKDIHKILDWLELIPFHETRNYVQRVLENLQVYRSILTKDDSLILKEDLLSARRI